MPLNRIFCFRRVDFLLLFPFVPESNGLSVATVNVNGVRAAVKARSEENTGLLGWLGESPAEYICLQEVRATEAEARAALAPVLADGWKLALAPAAQKGRSGVAILSRREPDAVRIGFGDPQFADSGRYIEADFGTFTLASLYLPSGEAETERQVEKDQFLKTFGEYLKPLARKRRDVLICGDWNIAHTELDIKNWKGNLKASGFLPHERAWLSEVFGEGSDWTDVQRSFHPGEAGPYSWWSFRGQAFDNDSGWRIDYHVANKQLAKRAARVVTQRAERYDLRWSDHAPVIVEYTA
ncbi:exodeoxyribonuclease III (xth) [Segniliparus rugosus ATCC BAA-974]|uniref:Exodeoxyribonuclease III (Xth) n=1 Tax=Segniliparus rugosus (strain ATCC BAA-974 / DSM 45345 / CCUG 50838 / CIP 108380 / JCM 13579 / CDC 945) TaxID=679197 RepID=E5XUF7_SEGRC|nr:exodeoxyribonuclease III (xth) [Segniliparus rugosus ATCC BAA-974]